MFKLSHHKMLYSVFNIENNNNDHFSSNGMYLPGNHYERKMVWVSPVVSKDGAKVWYSSKKPVDYNQYRVCSFPVLQLAHFMQSQADMICTDLMNYTPTLFFNTSLFSERLS